MTGPAELKRQVREFYDQTGWQQVDEGLYQNARYEDLRPVSREYIHRCHMRVARHLAPKGDLLLDAGSGPIQYPEYLAYSKGYRRRVCADISIVALKEARRRVGDHGLFVVADIANLPFKTEAFDGLVSLHTIHHLPLQEHARAYGELFRVLARGAHGVVVNGWGSSPFKRLIKTATRWWHARRGQGQGPKGPKKQVSLADPSQVTGTFVEKGNAAWLKKEVGGRIPLEIRVWRSVNVRFMRAFIHPRLAGRWFLRLLFWWEERLPGFFGENGVYPLVVIRKGR